jgi:hypothetical protein
MAVVHAGLETHAGAYGKEGAKDCFHSREFLEGVRIGKDSATGTSRATIFFMASLSKEDEGRGKVPLADQKGCGRRGFSHPEFAVKTAKPRLALRRRFMENHLPRRHQNVAKAEIHSTAVSIEL